jgi:CheY-like chemotaxis protein
LIELHGGSIRVESEVGRGSIFTVSLPIFQLPKASSVVDRTAVQRSASALILVVDADRASRRLAHDILLPRGHRVLEAESADTAISMLSEHKPDLVLVDLRVPGGGGERVLREVRQRPMLASIPVVVTTAEATTEHQGSLIASGFDGYVSKPIEAGQLGAMLEAFIARKHSS